MSEQATQVRPGSQRPSLGRVRTPYRIGPYNHGVPGDDLEILDVTLDPSELVMGHFRAQAAEGCKVEIVGWVLGQSASATEVEVVADGAIAGRAPVVLERPDVAEKFPDITGAASAGFRIELAAQGRGESQLEVFAVLDDESREPLGRMLVRAGRRDCRDLLPGDGPAGDGLAAA